MSDRLWERMGAACGIVYVVLLFAGEGALGDATHPPANTSGEKLVAFFEEYGTGSLIGAYLQALAAMLLLWFVASVATALALWGQRTTAVLVAAGGTVAVAVFLLYLLLSATLAFGVASPGGLDAGAAEAVYQVRFIALTFYSFPISVLVTATSIAALQLRFFPRWYGLFGMILAAAFLVGGATVAQSGFFAPDGDYGFILFWLFPLWLIVTSVLFMRRAGEPLSVKKDAPIGGVTPAG
jgi:hypothetical protein